MATEVDDLAVPGAEAPFPARIPASGYLERVISGLKRDFKGLAIFERTSSVAVDRDLEQTASKFKAETLSV